MKSLEKRRKIFEEKASKKHNYFYNYEKHDYQGKDKNVTITCPIHGDFVLKACNHLIGNKCPGCNGKTITSKFDKVKLKYNNKFLYLNESEIETIEDNLIVNCPEHGNFNTTLKLHMHSKHGCNQCSLEKIRSARTKVLRDFKIEFNKIKFPNKIKLIERSYIKASKEAEFICEKHGKFLRIPSLILDYKTCCQQCSKEYSNGWSFTKFKSLCIKNNNDKGILYLLRCYKDNEEFYKIGITSRSIRERYWKGENSHIPYKYEVLLQIEHTPDIIWELEKNIKSYIKEENLNYKPLIEFKGGITECFKTNNLENIFNYFQ